MRVEDLETSLSGTDSYHNFQATWSSDINTELLAIVLPSRLHILAPQSSKNPSGRIVLQSYDSIAWSPPMQGCKNVLLAAKNNCIFAISVDEDKIIATLDVVVAVEEIEKGPPVNNAHNIIDTNRE